MYNSQRYSPAENSRHGIISGQVRRRLTRYRDQRIINLNLVQGLSTRQIVQELARRGIAKIAHTTVSYVLRRAGLGKPLRSRRRPTWTINRRPLTGLYNKPSRSEPDRPGSTLTGDRESGGQDVQGPRSGSLKGVVVRCTEIIPKSVWQPEIDNLKAQAKNERLAFDLGWRKARGIWTRIDA